MDRTSSRLSPKGFFQSSGHFLFGALYHSIRSDHADISIDWLWVLFSFHAMGCPFIEIVGTSFFLHSSPFCSVALNPIRIFFLSYWHNCPPFCMGGVYLYYIDILPIQERKIERYVRICITYITLDKIWSSYTFKNLSWNNPGQLRRWSEEGYGIWRCILGLWR